MSADRLNNIDLNAQGRVKSVMADPDQTPESQNPPKVETSRSLKQKVGRVGGIILATAAGYGLLPASETKASPPEQGMDQVQEEVPLIIVATPGSEPYETPYDALNTEYFNTTRASIVRGRQLLGEYAVFQGLATQESLEDYFNRDIQYFIPGQSSPDGNMPVTPVPPSDGQHVPVFMIDQDNRFGFFVPGREIERGERNGFLAPFEGIDDFGNPQDFRWSFTEDGKVQGQNFENNVLIIGEGNEQAGFVAWIPGEAPEAAPLEPIELSINNPERLGNIELITSVPVTLPNGTQTTIRMWGNTQYLINSGYSPRLFTAGSAEPIQQIADMTLLNTDNTLNVLSYDRETTRNGDGRPDENGYRDGEALLEVDLSRPINIIVVSDVQSIPEIAGYTFNNEEPTNGFFISNRSDGQLELYYYPGKIETRLYYWRDVLGIPEEEIRAHMFTSAIAEPMGVIAMFQQNEIEGRNDYEELSQDFSARIQAHNSPWSPEWVNATIPIRRALYNTMEPLSSVSQTQ